MSKTIGNMTLKAVPVGADMIAIADSEDSDKTKKILLSAISGGGGGTSLQYYHELKNVQMTFNTGAYQNSYITADCDGLVAYEEGIYVLKSTSQNTGESGYGLYLNINNLGNKPCYVTAPYTYSSSHPLPKYFFQTNYIYIFAYSNNAFRCIYSYPLSDRQTMYDSLGGTSGYVYLDQASYMHSMVSYASALTSLEISGAPSVNQGFETEIHFTTGATFTFTATGLAGKWLGVSAPTFDPNTSYVIAIKNGYAVYAKVGA